MSARYMMNEACESHRKTSFRSWLRAELKKKRWNRIFQYTGSLRIAKPQIWRPSLRIPIHVQPQKEAEHRTKQQCIVTNFSHE